MKGLPSTDLYPVVEGGLAITVDPGTSQLITVRLASGKLAWSTPVEVLGAGCGP